MPPRWIDCRAKYSIALWIAIAGAACAGSADADDDTDASSSGAAASESTAPSCDVGALGCACTNGGGCDPGLVCEGGFCIAGDGPASSSTGSVLDEGSGTADMMVSATDGSGTTDDGSSSSTDGGDIDLDGWTRRREIVIDNPNAALDDFQVSITLPWDADFAPTLADLRFTDADGLELLPHHVDSFVAPIDAQVWVRVPQLAGAGPTTIYVYYGNPGAASVADPEATFLFWEPFDGVALDPTRWLAVGDHSVSGGTLTTTTGSVYSVAPIIDAPGVVAETRLRTIEPPPSSTPGASGITFSAAQAAMTPYAFTDAAQGSHQVSDGNMSPGGTLPGFSGLPQNTYVRVGLAMAPGATTHFIADLLPPLSHTNTLWFDADFYLLLGSINGAAAGGTELLDMEHDWVRTRRWALGAVTAEVGEEERP